MLKRMLIFLFVILCGFSAVVYLLGPSYLKRKVKLYVYAPARVEASYDQIKIESYNPVKVSITNITGKKSNDCHFSAKSVSAELNLKDILLNWGNKFVKFHLIIDGVNVFYKDVPIAGMEKETKLPNDMNAAAAANMRDFLKSSFGSSPKQIRTNKEQAIKSQPEFCTAHRSASRDVTSPIISP